MIQATLNVCRQLAEFDARLFLQLNRLHNRWELERSVRWISSTGDGYLYVLLAVTLPFLSQMHGTAFLLAGLLAFALELPIYWGLKHSFKRRRPFKVVAALHPLLKPSDEFSFPSGHTAAAFMMACLLSLFFPVVTVPVYLWASLVGLSRVMLRVHFVSDVLAGVVLGTAMALLSLKLLALDGVALI